MELLQLKYFCALAKNQHLTKTANQLMISPPALSLTISKLENELGVPLFNRVKRNIYLNENGEKFYQKVRAALDLIEQAEKEMAILRQKKINTVSVGVTSPVAWQDMFDVFRVTFPDITLEVQQVTREELDTLYPNFTFFIANGNDLPSSLRYIVPIRKEEMYILVVSKSHPLASKKSVTAEEVKGETFITLGDINQMTENLLIAFSNAHHFQPKKVIRTDYFSRINLVTKNKGVVLTTDFGYLNQFVNDGNCITIPVEDALLPKRYQSISWPKEQKLSEAAKLFLEFVKEYTGYK